MKHAPAYLCNLSEMSQQRQRAQAAFLIETMEKRPRQYFSFQPLPRYAAIMRLNFIT